MRKRSGATPSLALGLSLSSFAASIVKEEEKKKKRLRSAAAAAAKEVNDRGDDGHHRVDGDHSGEERSSHRIEKRKRLVGDGLDSDDRLRRSSLAEPPAAAAAGTSPSEDVSRENDGAEVVEDWTLPTDTMVALKMMWQQFPKSDQTSVQPFVLRSQLYSSVSDRTTADRELEELKQRHTVRIFKLNSGKDDFAVMLMEDYFKMIEKEKKFMEAKRPEEEIHVFDWFASHVVTAQTGVSIRHPHLISLLKQAGKATDKHVSLLINSGLLLRQIADETTYWFGIPNIGSLLKSLVAGRKELLSFLSRRRYKEILQGLLEKKRLRSSQFNMRFHIRDLQGSGHLFSIPTPAGLLIRLTRD